MRSLLPLDWDKTVVEAYFQGEEEEVGGKGKGKERHRKGGATWCQHRLRSMLMVVYRTRLTFICVQRPQDKQSNQSGDLAPCTSTYTDCDFLLLDALVCSRSH